MSLDAARAVIDEHLGRTFTACALARERAGARESLAVGTLCPDPNGGVNAPCTAASLFDLASLTKLATTALVLSLVKDRVLELEQPLRDLVPDFRGGAKDRVTLRQVLTHTAGLAWWKPLWREATSPDEVVWLAAQEPLARDPGTFAYSDLGYIMLTQGLASAGDAPFRDVLRERVLAPVESTCDFLPLAPLACVATEDDATWRMKRLRGSVHDENAHAMGGIAGHAGLFGTAADVLALARIYRDGAVIGNDLAREAKREHARGDNARRGIGLALRAPIGAMCGRWFDVSSFGHLGFTGTSLWVDPVQGLSVALLTNRVYFGRGNDEEMYRFRVAVHEALSAPE